MNANMRCKNIPRRDRCYFVGRRALTLKRGEAANAWRFMATRLESFGDKDMPKYHDVMAAIRDATIYARQQTLLKDQSLLTSSPTSR